MTSRRATISAAVASAFACALGGVMLRAGQGRDAASVSTTTGTGRLAGIVRDAQSTPQPVRRAIVTLTAKEVPAGRAAITDADGKFAFDRLPAGQFTLTASKPAYLRTAFGAIKPGGAIAGTVRDERGAPVVNTQMTFTRLNGGASPDPRADPVITNNRGEYRAFGLQPGRYLVSAGLLFSAGLGELGVMSTADVDATLASLRQRSAGAAPSRGSSLSSIVRPVKPHVVAPTFYPGVGAASEATPIVLALGE